MGTPIFRHDVRSLAVLDAMRDGTAKDANTLTAKVGFPVSPSLRHLFMCGLIVKVDRGGYKGSFRYRAVKIPPKED